MSNVLERRYELSEAHPELIICHGCHRKGTRELQLIGGGYSLPAHWTFRPQDRTEWCPECVHYKRMENTR